MEKKKLHSYGIIPLRKNTKGEAEVLLIDQKDRLDPTKEYWTFPKGTPRWYETGHMTAIRETREETGIVCDVVDGMFTYTDCYTFTDSGVEYDKTVTYFLGRAKEGEVQIQHNEVKDYAWLTLPLAREKLTYERGKKIIDAIVAYLPTSRLFDAK